MGWRDIYAVHPAADCWPMMPEDELAKLQEDIERNGVRMPIGLYDELDADGTVIKTWLIDGRNRLEAAEHAGLDIESIHVARVHCSNPVSWIISLNARRKHLTKQAIADGIVASLEVAERQKRQAIDALTKEQNAFGIETLLTHEARVAKIRRRMQERS